MALNFNREGAVITRRFLFNEGFTEAGTYAVLANVYAESNFKSDNLQNSYEYKLGVSDPAYVAAVDSGAYTRANFVNDSAGFGLCQWTHWSRKQALYDFVKSLKASIGDMDAQLAFMMHELKYSYRTIYETLKTSKDMEHCTRLIMTKYERPADQSEANQQKRVNYAKAIYTALTTGEEDALGDPLRIALDPGHGLYTAGKRCKKSLDSNETREWVLNDRVADYVMAQLSHYHCVILRVDDPEGKTDPSNTARATKANNWGADVYIAIHHNAGAYGTSAGGIVVFYYSSKAERKAQATALYDLLIANTGLKGNRSKPVAKKGFTVIAKTSMPAFLIEGGFMDSKIDVPVILSDAHAQKYATSIVQFLVTQFGLKLAATSAPPVQEEEQPKVEESVPETQEPATEGDNIRYRVQCGSFKVQANAVQLKEKLKADGYDATIVKVDIS